jgi:hypothetical protein
MKKNIVKIVNAVICLVIVVVSIIFFHKDIHILTIIFGGLGLVLNLADMIKRNKGKRSR